MLFSSNTFLFFFLPTVLIVYYTILRKSRTAQNVFLCFASLFFYAWGEPRFVLVMMLSILVNWAFGLLVDRYRERKTVRLMIAADLCFNLVIIFIFKYLNFAADNAGALLGREFDLPEIALPIGISFFTFQAISYVIDVYRRKGEAQKNILNVALYISFFPQLIAGPIVRYETVAYQIKNRTETFDDFSEGVCRFIVGLAKKVLIANNMAVVADKAFGLTESAAWMGEAVHLSAEMAWLGIIAYALQIFFDFSGYSDMAIGLGRMFGFHFLENFNYPYISRSATEFWRRWHISLGTWFRDYLYIPLGGSRVKTPRIIFNLFVVWFCTGVWHGANWTFILWGLMYYVLLVFEKFTFFRRLSDNGLSGALRYVYAMFFVLMGWVTFRAGDIGQAAEYYKALFTVMPDGGSGQMALFYLRQYAVFFLAGILFSVPIVPKIRELTGERFPRLRGALYVIVMILLFLVSISFIVKGSYNPFIYFNF